MADQAMVEQSIPATMKVPESLWKRIRIKAISEGRTVSQVVQKMLEDSLAADVPVRKPCKTNGNGEGQ